VLRDTQELARLMRKHDVLKGFASSQRLRPCVDSAVIAAIASRTGVSAVASIMMKPL
jgi:hypothetical protein